MKSTTAHMDSRKHLSAVVSGLRPERNIEDLKSRVAVSAYYKAEARGFAPGNELKDWLAAEAEQKSW